MVLPDQILCIVLARSPVDYLEWRQVCRQWRGICPAANILQPRPPTPPLAIPARYVDKICVTYAG